MMYRKGRDRHDTGEPGRQSRSGDREGLDPNFDLEIYLSSYSRARHAPEQVVSDSEQVTDDPQHNWGGTDASSGRDNDPLGAEGDRGRPHSSAAGSRAATDLVSSGFETSMASLDAEPNGRPFGHHAAGPHVARGRGSGTPLRIGPRATPRLAGAACLAAGAGVALDGLAVMLAWRGSGLGPPLFWLAITGPFLAFVVILVWCRPSRAARQWTVVLLGLYPAVVYRMSSPLVLEDFDEHLHERTLTDLLHGSGLFAPNPILTVGPRYPGLELFTGFLIRLTDLPMMAGMSLAIFICRVLLVLAIYHGALDVTRSYRRASLMVIFYAASPQFYFFDALFAYETMALTLAVGGLVILNRAMQDYFGVARRPLVVVATIALLASVVTHHATSWLTVAFLVGWTVTAKRPNRRTLAYVTALMASAVFCWTALSINQLAPYIGPIFHGIFSQLISSAGHVHPFQDTAGGEASPLARAISVLYALLATGAALIGGFRVLRRAHREKHYTLAFVALLSISFPAVFASHLVPSTTFYGDRASDFLALPVAFCFALAVRNPSGALRLRKVRARIYRVALIGGAVLAFAGGVAFGTGPSWNFLPGKYLVEADGHNEDAETLAAVRWAAQHLPAGSRIVADRIPADLLAGEARLWPLKGPQDGLNPAAIYFAKTWEPSLIATIERLDIQYIYVDLRLATSLPHDGYYINADETAGPVQLSRAALTKFAGLPGLSVVYHHGPVTIYDTSGLGVNMTTKDGFVGNRSMGPSAPVQVVLGAAIVVLLALLLRTRWPVIVRTMKQAGIAGSGVAALAGLVFLGGLLFGLRWMPGWAFTVGAAEMAVVLIVVHRWTARKSMIPRMHLIGVGQALVLLGLLALAIGVFLDLHSAWSVDITSVDHILSSVAHHG